MSDDTKNILGGMIAGALIWMFIDGIFEFGHREGDYWCEFLGTRSDSCYRMYDQAIENAQRESELNSDRYPTNCVLDYRTGSGCF